MKRPPLVGALALIGTLTVGATAAAAPAPKPPAAYTGYAPATGPSSATLNAHIDPRGLATEYHFEYGTTTAYGSQTPSASAGAEVKEVKVSQAIGGLAPYTTYHFRIVASNSVGTSDGQDATFKTKKLPLSLALSATPNPAVFGRPLVVSGTLSGTGNAGIPVVLQANQFPYTHGFHDITSPEPTGAAGEFEFPIAGLLGSVQLRAATVVKPVIRSAVLTELVTVHVTLHVRRARRRGFVRLFGTVAPAEPGALVAFERRDRTGNYVTVSGTTVKAGGNLSRFARTVRLRGRGLYRALVQIPSGSVVSGRSRPIAIR